jgi:hypothetical protein
LGIAEQINQEWWDKNNESFLKGIKKWLQILWLLTPIWYFQL